MKIILSLLLITTSIASADLLSLVNTTPNTHNVTSRANVITLAGDSGALGNTYIENPVEVTDATSTSFLCCNDLCWCGIATTLKAYTCDYIVLISAQETPAVVTDRFGVTRTGNITAATQLTIIEHELFHVEIAGLVFTNANNYANAQLPFIRSGRKTSPASAANEAKILAQEFSIAMSALAFGWNGLLQSWFHSDPATGATAAAQVVGGDWTCNMNPTHLANIRSYANTFDWGAQIPPVIPGTGTSDCP